MAKKRKPKHTIFIACEGTHTEPLYFERMKEIMEEDDEYPFSITIYPDKNADKNPKTDAIGLIKTAVERKDDFNELWAVFDKNGYTKHEEAFQLAKKNDIHIAFSSIAFETWILLHFERCAKAFSKSMEIIDEKFSNEGGYLPLYAKSGEFNVYPLINKNIDTALRNAAWLRAIQKLKNPTTETFDLNPYTEVDFLVKKIQLIDIFYDFKFVSISKPFVFKNILIAFVANDAKIIAEIQNNDQKSLLSNQFCFFDAKGRRIEVKNRIIEPGTTAKIELESASTIFLEFDKLRIELTTNIEHT